MAEHDNTAMTSNARAVARVLMNNPDRPLAAHEISNATGLPLHVVHAMLTRLSQRGWVRRSWVSVVPDRGRAFRRRLYRIPISQLNDITASLDRGERDG